MVRESLARAYNRAELQLTSEFMDLLAVSEREGVPWGIVFIISLVGLLREESTLVLDHEQGALSLPYLEN